jgi:hypothetical protein
MLRTRASMSDGWSPTGTFVMPGRSTIVMFNTCGENIFSRSCFSEIPLLLPSSRSVSNCSKESEKYCLKDNIHLLSAFRTKRKHTLLLPQWPAFIQYTTNENKPPPLNQWNEFSVLLASQ